MTTEGVDYSFSHPTALGLKAAGKRFAMRYVGPFCDNSPKGLTPAEATALEAAGLSIVYLVEGTASGALLGRAQGISDATSALAYVRKYRWPTDRPFYVAVDFDCTPAQWPAVVAYLQGFASVVGLNQTGVYGGIRVMQWAARDKVASWFFQTYAWSAGLWYAGNHVRQYDNGVQVAGGDVDLCTAMVDDYGQWPNAGGDADMTPDQANQLRACQTILDGLARGLVTVYPDGAYPDKDGHLDLTPFWNKIADVVIARMTQSGGTDHTHTVTATAAGSTGPAIPLDPTP